MENPQFIDDVPMKPPFIVNSPIATFDCRRAYDLIMLNSHMGNIPTILKWSMLYLYNTIPENSRGN